MRTLAVAMILFLTSLVSSAQPDVFEIDKPVTCSDPKTVIETLSDQYQEQPFWSGRDRESKYILFVNSKTGSWSMVEYNDKVACVVGLGKNAKQIFSSPGV
jgi:hypothetical protein